MPIPYTILTYLRGMDLQEFVVDLGQRLQGLTYVSLRFPPEYGLEKDGVWRITRSTVEDGLATLDESELPGSLRVDAEKLDRDAGLQVLRGGPFAVTLC